MQKKIGYFLVIVITTVLTGNIVALLMNIRERKAEEKVRHIDVVQLSEKDTDPEIWKRNYPREYDGYKKTSDIERTRYGGSEAFSKLDEDPSWKRFFAGYAFGIDYREDRGHAYSLEDQKETLRTKQFKQPGACLQCHAGGMKNVYETVGNGNLMQGFAEVNAMPLEKAWAYAKHPVACIDCHDPKTMELRVTRPGFLSGIKALKEHEGIKNYDPNTMATHQEMRTFVCGQCHVEYYFKGPEKYLTYPWSKGVKVEEIESYYNEAGHKDWVHAETGAPVLKAQHPEFELWSQGVHSKSGVSCADCHMPYKREGAAKVTDHHIRSPLLNTSRACLQCHHFTENEMKERVETIQARTRVLMDRAEAALLDLIDAIVKAKKAGATEDQLKLAYEMHRKAQWRLDFVSAENSMGFHAPQEAARILAESIDYARQGQVAVEGLQRA
ncbi:MAG: nitrite reductase [Omnitrophica bacterium RIFCSPHIGHO2_02_FULL_46_11]|nr:MAG: nitrite reductase [Omnitrophica bacterium RIFCSPHIGHO2_02_FULL_46_11]